MEEKLSATNQHGAHTCQLTDIQGRSYFNLQGAVTQHYFDVELAYSQQITIDFKKLKSKVALHICDWHCPHCMAEIAIAWPTTVPTTVLVSST